MRRTWAVVFDMDDTLYSYDEFVGSGYRAVGAHLADARGADASAVVHSLWQARALAHGQEFQAMCLAHGWPPELAPHLVDVFRHHQPAIRLAAGAALVLEGLRRRGWRLGVLTNGSPRVQRAKVRALGLEPLVDGVVYAEEAVSGGKPASAAFHAIVTRLGSDPARTVMVGDDLRTDIGGARHAGLHAIHMASPATLAAVPEMLDVLAARCDDAASGRDTLSSPDARGTHPEAVHVG